MHNARSFAQKKLTQNAKMKKNTKLSALNPSPHLSLLQQILHRRRLLPKIKPHTPPTFLLAAILRTSDIRRHGRIQRTRRRLRRLRDCLRGRRVCGRCVGHHDGGAAGMGEVGLLALGCCRRVGGGEGCSAGAWTRCRGVFREAGARFGWCDVWACGQHCWKLVEPAGVRKCCLLCVLSGLLTCGWCSRKDVRLDLREAAVGARCPAYCFGAALLVAKAD